MKKKPFFWGIAGSLVIFALEYFIFLPPLNPTSFGFWICVWIACVPLLLAASVGFVINRKVINGSKPSKFIFLTFLLSVVGVLLITIGSSSIFHASEYAQRIDLKESKFDEINEVDFTKTAIIDRNSTLVLGDRTLGQLPELISQFNVSDIYSQISYQDSVVRVTPLDYNGIFKYFSNKAEGVPAYITVNASTGKSDLVKLADLGLDGMKYTENAILFEDRDRHMRFAYPTEIFYETNFEIDEQGVPYWITTTVKYKGIGQKATVTGVIAMNAIDGSMTKYEIGSIPNWIDRVYPSNIILDQVNQSGSYIHGFFNSIFGQRDVYLATEGYNYIELNGDIWLYTGITSANADESNIGFVLINQRTHEAKKIMSPGAEEFSAMSSAEGKVQNLGYTSTFPLLINVSGRPTYLVSLKDNAGLVKMYAMIDCEDYQRVYTVEAEQGLEALKRQYIAGMNIVDESSKEETQILIAQISTVNISGDTYYYIKDDKDDVYKVIATLNEAVVPFMQVGDLYEVTITKGDGVNTITSIKLITAQDYKEITPNEDKVNPETKN